LKNRLITSPESRSRQNKNGGEEKIVGKTKTITLISLIAVAAIVGTIMLTVSANEEETSTAEETSIPPLRWSQSWISALTDDQKAELEAMQEEFHSAVQAKLEEWDVEIEQGWMCNLTEEQRTELHTMRHDFDEAVKEKLEEWSVEIPEVNGVKGWMSNLTEEQRAELQTMREEYQDAVQTKLEEWGVETPDFPNQIGFEGFGPMHHGPGDLGF
jgi:hypothetical protein